MPKFSKYLKLYCTDLVTLTTKVIADPVRVEFFQGPREYDTFVRVSPPIVRAGVDRILFAPKRMVVAGSELSYIEIIVRAEHQAGRRQYCEDEINRVVTQLSAVLTPALFNFELWSGWLSDSEQALGGGWVGTSPAVQFEPAELERQIESYRLAVAGDPDIEQRFTLMSKLFSRAIATEPGEERFLWLWTVLEVFPMRDTSNIQPISGYLGRVTGRVPAEVKSALDLGKLFDSRCDLVHNGRLPYSLENLGEVLEKLEAIDTTVLRALGGLPYAGQIDKYFP
ncbi:MAG: hypothetical protein LAO56_09405 [Acidobacteriia bacterium]|nr:hypothetical protein [Terriglobia bacterium]